MLNLISDRLHISSISEISDWMKSLPSVGQSTLLWTAALAGTDMYFLGFIFFEVALFVGFLTPEWFSWHNCLLQAGPVQCAHTWHSLLLRHFLQQVFTERRRCTFLVLLNKRENETSTYLFHLKMCPWCKNLWSFSNICSQIYKLKNTKATNSLSPGLRMRTAVQIIIRTVLAPMNLSECDYHQ